MTDNGPGIPAGDQKHIFKRLYCSDRTRHFPGFGLGLSMVAAIADLRRFDLRIEDNRPRVVIEISPPRAN